MHASRLGPILGGLLAFAACFVLGWRTAPNRMISDEAEAQVGTNCSAGLCYSDQFKCISTGALLCSADGGSSGGGSQFVGWYDGGSGAIQTANGAVAIDAAGDVTTSGIVLSGGGYGCSTALSGLCYLESDPTGTVSVTTTNTFDAGDYIALNVALDNTQGLFFVNDTTAAATLVSASGQEEASVSITSPYNAPPGWCTIGAYGSANTDTNYLHSQLCERADGQLGVNGESFVLGGEEDGGGGIASYPDGGVAPFTVSGLTVDGNSGVVAMIDSAGDVTAVTFQIADGGGPAIGSTINAFTGNLNSTEPGNTTVELADSTAANASVNCTWGDSLYQPPTTDIHGSCSMSSSVDYVDGGFQGSIGYYSGYLTNHMFDSRAQNKVVVIPRGDGGPGFCETGQTPTCLVGFNDNGTAFGAPSSLANQFVNQSQLSCPYGTGTLDADGGGGFVCLAQSAGVQNGDIPYRSYVYGNADGGLIGSNWSIVNPNTGDTTFGPAASDNMVDTVQIQGTASGTNTPTQPNQFVRREDLGFPTDGGMSFATGWLPSFDCDLTALSNMANYVTLPDGGAVETFNGNTALDGGFTGADGGVNTDGGSIYLLCGLPMAVSYSPQDGGSNYAVYETGGLFLEPQAFGQIQGSTFNAQVMGWPLTSVCPQCSATTPIMIVYNVASLTFSIAGEGVATGLAVPVLPAHTATGYYYTGGTTVTFQASSNFSGFNNVATSNIGISPNPPIGTQIGLWPDGFLAPVRQIEDGPAYSGGWPSPSAIQHQLTSVVASTNYENPPLSQWQVFLGAYGDNDAFGWIVQITHITVYYHP